MRKLLPKGAKFHGFKITNLIDHQDQRRTLQVLVQKKEKLNKRMFPMAHSKELKKYGSQIWDSSSFRGSGMSVATPNSESKLKLCPGNELVDTKSTNGKTFSTRHGIPTFPRKTPSI